MKNLMLVFAMMTMVLVSCKKEEIQLPDNKEELLTSIPVGDMVDSKGKRVDVNDVPTDFKQGTTVTLEVGEYVYKASDKNLVTVKVKACESCRGNVNEIEYAIPYGYSTYVSAYINYTQKERFTDHEIYKGGIFAVSNDTLYIVPYFNDTLVIKAINFVDGEKYRYDFIEYEITNEKYMLWRDLQGDFLYRIAGAYFINNSVNLMNLETAKYSFLTYDDYHMMRFFGRE